MPERKPEFVAREETLDVSPGLSPKTIIILEYHPAPERKPEFIAREKTPDAFPGLSPKTLANLASLGRGPSYFLVGRRAFYRYDDIVAWLSRHPVKTKES